MRLFAGGITVLSVTAAHSHEAVAPPPSALIPPLPPLPLPLPILLVILFRSDTFARMLYWASLHNLEDGGGGG